MTLMRILERSYRAAYCLALAPLVMCAACSGPPNGSDSSDTGEADVGVSTQALSTLDVARVTLTVGEPGRSPVISRDLGKVGGQWNGKLSGIPVGSSWTFHADAYDLTNTKVFQGEAANVEIVTGVRAVVALVLQQVSTPTPFANSVPQVSSLTLSSSQVEQGATVAIVVTATDADQDPLAYAWTATGGSFVDATVSAPTWIAPASDGTYQLSVSVNDGKGGQSGLSVHVKVASRGAADVSTRFNAWPAVVGMSATPGQLSPGQSATMSVTATDADGDSISYLWRDNCGGIFSTTTAQDPTWTAPTTAPSDAICTLTVTASDNQGGSTSGTLVVGINSPMVIAPPIIDQSFLSTDTVSSANSLDLSVAAHDPAGGALSFFWSASGGTLESSTDTASGSEVRWTAPPQSGAFTVTATVTNASGQSASHEFTVTVTSAGDGNQGTGASAATAGSSCLALLNAGANSDGVYWISPLGGEENAFQVYCDMTTDGGGWTRVVGVNQNNVNHSNPAAVPWTDGSPLSDGKLADATINMLKSSTSASVPAIRLMLSGRVAYFPGSCVFDASPIPAAGDCLKYSKTYDNPTWHTAANNDRCPQNSSFATLSAVQIAGGCGSPDTEDSVSIAYRRMDWRGEAYDGVWSGSVWVK